MTATHDSHAKVTGGGTKNRNDLISVALPKEEYKHVTVTWRSHQLYCANLQQCKYGLKELTRAIVYGIIIQSIIKRLTVSCHIKKRKIILTQARMVITI